MTEQEKIIRYLDFMGGWVSNKELLQNHRIGSRYASRICELNQKGITILSKQGNRVSDHWYSLGVPISRIDFTARPIKLIPEKQGELF